MKHGGKALFGGAVTVALLWWALHDVDFGELWANILSGDPWLLLASAALTTVGFGIRALRWSVFLEPVIRDTGLRSRFAAVAIHFMVNNVLPLRVGEFARAWVFARIEPAKATAVFGTVVVERFMDGVVLLALLVLPVFTPGFPDVAAMTTGGGGAIVRAAAVGVLVILVALVSMAAFPILFVRIAERVAPLLPGRVGEPLLTALGSFLESLAVLRDPRLLTLGFLWTFAFWAYQALAFHVGMLAFGIETGYVSAVFTSSVVAFAVALPSAPGFFGTFHAAAAFALSDVYGASDAQSLAFAFGYHFGGWLPITLIGFYFLWTLGLSLGDVGHADERIEPEVDPVAGADRSDG